MPGKSGSALNASQGMYDDVNYDLLKALFHESRPVLNSARHVSRMDVIERSPERPVLFDVVYLKLDVWRNHDRLSRTQVDPDDFGTGIGISYLDAPEACATADVQDPLGTVADRSQMKSALRDEVEHGMYQIQSIEFILTHIRPHTQPHTYRGIPTSSFGRLYTALG
ncbi:hypothetical protein VTN96DRAFT_9340 [Rasamsonia emersonii]